MEESIMAANIVLPRYMRVGAGASQELAGLLQQLGVKHPFIVTDQDMVRFGYLDALTRGLDDAGIPYAVFADTVPDPTVASVNEGVAALKKQDHDGVVALGGGSPIDSAKAIAHLSVHGGRMRDYKAPVMSDTQGLPLVAILTAGGWGPVTSELAAYDPGFADPINLGFGAFLGMVGIGLGSPGNPHILVRYMSIDDPEQLKWAAGVGTTWNALMGAGAVLIGLVGRVYVPEVSMLPAADTETLFPILAQQHLHPVLFGVVVASIFAAIMSTADSQLLVAASTVVRDVYQRVARKDDELGDRHLVLLSRIVVAVLVVAALILGLMA
jgi:hypothetical protein